MGVQTIIALSTRGTNITAMVVTNASTTIIVMTIVAMLQRPRLYVLFNAIAEVAITTIVAVLSVAITIFVTTTLAQATSTTRKTQSLLFCDSNAESSKYAYN